MAIRYAHDNNRVPISDIVDEVGHHGTTDTSELSDALDNWNVVTREVAGGDMEAVCDAISWGHVVLVPIVLDDLPKGADFPDPFDKDNCGENTRAECHTNRYYDHGITHWVVVKGISDDKRWVIVYDPNVFGTCDARQHCDNCYWYKNGEPKGKERYYSYSEFETAFDNANAEAIEVLEAPGVAVSLIIDSTGSMDWNDPYDMRKAAAKVFIDAAQPGDKIAVVGFDSTDYHFGPLRTIQSQADRDALKAAVDQIGNWWNGTDINVALQGGFDELLSDPTVKNGRSAVLLTDGEHNQDSYRSQNHLQYRDQGWPVYTIGLGNYAGVSLLQQIASDTGGRLIGLDDPNQLQAVYFEISQQIAGGRSILEESVTMAQGISQQVVADLPSQQSSASFFTAWGGGEVSLELVSPSDRRIGPSNTDSDVYHAKGLTYELYRLQQPEAGRWIIDLFGTSLPTGGEEVDVRVAVQGPRHLFLPVVLRDFVTSTKLYVTDWKAGVAIIDTSTNTIVGNIPTGARAQGITSSPDGTRAYTADSDVNQISVIDLTSNSVVKAIPVANHPVIPVLSPDGSRLYVTGSQSNSVFVIDTTTDTLVETITGVPYPWGIAVSPDGSEIAVTLYWRGAVAVFDTSTHGLVGEISVGTKPEGAIYHPDGTTLYVANLASSSISVISTATHTVVDTISVGSLPGNNPVQLTFNPSATRLYVANDVSQTASEIEVASSTVVRSFEAGSGPRDVEVVGQFLYVTNARSNSISVVDLTTGETVETITGFRNPHSITR